MEEVERRRPSRVGRYSAIAGDLYGITFDGETNAAWADFIHLTQIMDAALDDTPGWLNEQESEELLEKYIDPQFLEAEFPSLAPSHNPEHYDRLKTMAQRLMQLNRYIKQTSSHERYVSLKQLEGRCYAQMILACCSEDVIAQANYQEFASDFIKLGEAGILFDTLIDNSRDFRRGETQVKLSPQERFRLIGRSAIIMKGVYPKLIRPKPLVILMATSVKVALDRTK